MFSRVAKQCYCTQCMPCNANACMRLLAPNRWGHWALAVDTSFAFFILGAAAHALTAKTGSGVADCA